MTDKTKPARRIQPRISDELGARLDGALAVVPRAMAPSESALVVIALEAHLTALEKRFNGGKPFKAPRA